MNDGEDKTTISTSEQIHPKIYAWSTPDIPKYLDWLKIGYTRKQTVEKRVSQQASQLSITQHIEWQYDARFQNGGEWFTDHEFHHYLQEHQIPREDGTEWFDFRPENAKQKSQQLFKDFVFQDYSQVQQAEKFTDYRLRSEQQEAVTKTLNYFKDHSKGEFLWNAKPRFGKTLTTYDLIRHLDSNKVLIVTNRPAIANSWYDDFAKFISWQTNFRFVSTTDTLRNKPVLSRKEFTNEMRNNPDLRMIAFLSLQDLKGSQFFGGNFNKLRWVHDLDWDLLVIDEAHEGVDTFRTDKAFDQISRSYTLHLSGTPFKAIASGKFSDDQIFNWSYQDEQQAKASWSDPGNSNPYEELPTLNMFTYQMSRMITDEVNQGADLDESHNVDYAFDLNEFFSTDGHGKFIHETEVRKFLERLTTNKKYPFSTPELRDELKHTFWLVGNRVASAKAMARLLRSTSAFEDYYIVVAAGHDNGVEEEATDTDSNLSSFDKVTEAIKNHDKTITISVGQLTTGVTIPEWTGVLMLSNLTSPSLYMQAAFRVQNPWSYTDKDGNLYQKKNAYVFDFAPERTLETFDAFANDLNKPNNHVSVTSQDRQRNIKQLLNFFPVIGEDDLGEMTELDATKIVGIPRSIKAKEVVKRGFMSNLLFSNINDIFQAPQEVLDIINQISPAIEPRNRRAEDKIQLPSLEIDENGEVAVSKEIVIKKNQAIFGPKIYQVDDVTDLVNGIETSESNLHTLTTNTAKQTIDTVIRPKLQTIVDQTGQHVSKATQIKILDQIVHDMAASLTRKAVQHQIERINLEKRFEQQLEKTEDSSKRKALSLEKQTKLERLTAEFSNQLVSLIEQETERAQEDAIQKIEVQAATEEKNDAESDVRDRLRGFARTIPSFIMAYGNEELTLANFDDYTPDSVFLEVTGITTEQFRKLRDGGQYENADGETVEYPGFFDEVTFNQSIKEFLNKKQQLANYFDDNSNEDIFDYIPPQKTNQIYTPKKVVRDMVDQLERENEGIFSDSSARFVDLYMKSGLYPVEIVKRLFIGLEHEIPNKEERLRHILEHQVYGFAPSEIIFHIATNYIFGFDKDNTISHKNFIMADTIPYAKKDDLQTLINEKLSE